MRILPVMAALASAPVAFATDVSEVAASMLADAEMRAFLSKGAATYDGGFRITPDDPDAPRLTIKGFFQTRLFLNAADDFESGFVLPRARLDFRVAMPRPKLQLRINTELAGSRGPRMLDVYGVYDNDDGFRVRFGQFRGRFNRAHGMTSVSRQLGLDRPLNDVIFRINRVQGLEFTFQGERVRTFATVSDGRASLNSDFISDRSADFALTGRVETRLGDASWRQYRDYTAFPDDDFGVLLGLGGHWQEGGATTAAADFGGRFGAVTFDVGLEGPGWNLSASVNGRWVDSGEETFEDYGFDVQGGAFITDDAELFAAYNHVWIDNDRGGTDFPSIGAGGNWYIAGHALKFTVQATYYPEPTTDLGTLFTGRIASLGLLTDVDGDQVVIGAQMQISF
ncbi:MAG: hypothetical protein AAFX05_09040 [Planctomycetota bacterium]